MITPDEIKVKGKKLFSKIVSDCLNGETVFPLEIRSNKKLTGNNYSDWKNDLVPLYQQSKDGKGRGYKVDWKETLVNGSKQRMPEKLYFESLDDYLYFIDQRSEFQKIQSAFSSITTQFPELKGWAVRNPIILLENYDKVGEIIKVCSYFVNNNPPYNFFLRELPIEVHSKFIEENVSLLSTVLDIILPEEKKISIHKEFEKKFQLKTIPTYIRLRILDKDLKSILGYHECILTMEDVANLNWKPRKVFIVENQVCYLTFPEVKEAIAIFGEGFKTRVNKHISWLDNTELYCWFDLDGKGFEILNMVRQYYCNAKSFLMDFDTFNRFQDYSVPNPSINMARLSNLTAGENELYEFLVSNKKRLEQERITQDFVLKKIKTLY